jgi:ectoine hydroxylase-related dioxygenase (phytanoyl-CoA dioxygenase family)
MHDDQALIVSSMDEAPATLRARFQDWGYLYIKHYVSKANCEALLNDFMEPLASHIARDTATGLPVLTGQPFVETDAIWDEVYPKMQSLESFHGFFHDQPILDLMKIVSDSDVFVYPMKMARVSTPGRIGYETPPHQDARSHVAGPTMAGIWVALHDISADMGRLKILPRSHKHGVRPVVNSIGVGNVQCEIYPDETVWHVSDVEQGDVIIFNSCTVHAAQPNTSKDIVRMSVDTRFCDYGAPVFSSNLEPHHGWRIDSLDWKRIYNDWQQTALQYYWKDYPNLF